MNITSIPSLWVTIAREKFDCLKEKGAETSYLPLTPKISINQIKIDLKIG